MKAVLTIAGSDCSGGAGIQADLKTMLANGVYGMSVITALTAQNTTGVKQMETVSASFLRAQLDCVFTDILPDAVKIGMIPTAELVWALADRLEYYHAENIVLDPVMAASSGSALMQKDCVDVLKNKIFPMATVLTPNLSEMEILTGMSVRTAKDMEEAARQIGETYGCAVLCKGGHRTEDANDLLYMQGKMQWYFSPRIHNPNTHGTGCTLSSAIAANLAKGNTLEEAVRLAKQYLSGALKAGLNIGKGNGPLHHGFGLSVRLCE